MIPGNYNLIIFDWDGTLMDSAHKIVSCFQSAARDCGLPVPEVALVEFQIGLTLEIAWSNILSSLGVSEDPGILQRASDRYRDYFLELDQTPMPLYDGVIKGIQSLEKEGYLLAIATGKARRGLQRALLETDLQKHFVYSRCADEAYSKPHPKMLLDILDYCGCDADRALMVGDTTYDMQMASNAGIDGLAVAYGVHAEHVLAPFASMGCAVNFEDVLLRIQQP
jgi:phosphoglycolate phosphatase